MSIVGDLSSMPVEDLLGWVAASARSGTLEIDGSEFSKRLIVQDGNLVAASSTNPREFPGTYLVGWGHVTAEELDHAVEMQGQQGVLAGELLVKTGCITPAVLDRILLVVAEEAIFDTFLWTSGRFHLEEGELPSQRFRPLELALVPLLVEGARRRDELPQIRSLLPTVDHRPRVISGADQSPLARSELRIVARADGKRSVEQIAFACRTRVFVAWEILAKAARTGLIEVLPPAAITGHEQSPESYGSVRALVTRCERSIDAGRLDEAWQTIQLIGRRFRTAADINVLIKSLRRRLEQALDRKGLSLDRVPLIGLLDDQLLESVEGSPERTVVARVDGEASLAQILRHLPDDRIANRLLVRELVERGVLELR